MERLIALILLGSTLFNFSCNNEEVQPSLYSTEAVFEDMKADFDIIIEDSTVGRILLIDRCENIDKIEWSAVYQSEWVYIPSSFPGDTLVLEVEYPGDYVIKMEAYSASNSVNNIIKSKVKTFTFLSGEIQEEVDSTLVPFLKSISIINYPSRDSEGFFWDIDTLPDVSLEIRYTAFDEYHNFTIGDTVFTNLDWSDLPIILPVELGHRIDDFQLTISLNDIDSYRENYFGDERMSTERYWFSEIDPRSRINWFKRSKVLGVQSYDGRYTRLEVEWR